MRRFGRLTASEELELAHHVAAGEQWARQQLLGLIEQPIFLDLPMDEETDFSLADTL